MSKKQQSSAPKQGVVLMIIRLILGAVFIFSSVVKGIDPMGTAYRVEDYFGAYNLMWMHGFELPLSFFFDWRLNF